MDSDNLHLHGHKIHQNAEVPTCLGLLMELLALPKFEFASPAGMGATNWSKTIDPSPLCWAARVQHCSFLLWAELVVEWTTRLDELALYLC